MKKTSYWLIAVGLMAIACTDTRQDDQVLTDKLKANARTEEKVNKVIDQLRKDCDSTLLQEAVYKADSIRKARQKPAKHPHHRLGEK